MTVEPTLTGADGLIHATVVARYRPQGWRGVLIGGGSGAGKSDLALRLMATGWRLIADDYAWVWRSGEGLYATAPATIAGLIEARGVGIASAAFAPSVQVALFMECQAVEPERLPQARVRTLSGVDIPVIALNPLHASAPVKLEAALAVTLSALGQRSPLA